MTPFIPFAPFYAYNFVMLSHVILLTHCVYIWAMIFTALFYMPSISPYLLFAIPLQWASPNFMKGKRCFYFCLNAKRLFWTINRFYWYNKKRRCYGPFLQQPSIRKCFYIYGLIYKFVFFIFLIDFTAVTADFFKQLLQIPSAFINSIKLCLLQYFIDLSVPGDI